MAGSLNAAQIKAELTGDFLNAVGPHVEQHGAVEYAAAELEKTVQRQGGHVGFTPPLPAVLNVLLELQPPDQTQTHNLSSEPDKAASKKTNMQAGAYSFYCLNLMGLERMRLVTPPVMPM